MKYVVVIIDGAADYPIDILKGKTPLQAADTPFMDSLAKEGTLGRVKTVPRGFAASSDITNLSLLGYDPKTYYTGRGPLEAANLGVDLGRDDVAFRCNLVTEAEGKLLDYSAGHITNKESRALMDCISKKLGVGNVEFYFGTSYRNLMVIRGAKRLGLERLKFSAPHDIMGEDVESYLPKGKNNDIIIDIMNKSKKVLLKQEINKVRIDLGESPANMIWLWGAGVKPTMPTFKERYGLEGAVISAVDLIKGIGKVINLKVLDVEGANGYYDTNYIGKAQAALLALEECDFVFVHIEATDEAGHNQDLRMKIACLERIDKMVIGTIIEGLKNEEFRILVTPDHPTPISKRTHTDEPVPFLMSGSGVEAGNFTAYSEVDAQDSSLYFNKGVSLLNYFLGK